MKMKPTFSTVIYLFLFKCVAVLSDVKVVNNGYDNVVVAIGKDVAEDNQLVENIKEYFTEASERLYNATKKRLYFRNINILLPKSWSKRDVGVPQGDTFDNAIIRIDKANPMYGENPYTLQTGGCGEAGTYIHFTPKFFLNKTTTTYYFGPPSRTIVHEWGHVRWGLFDEYPRQSQSEQHFYARGRRILPVKCNDKIRGHAVIPETMNKCKIDYKTMQVDENCRFYPDREKPQPASSIMYMQFLESVEDFCDNNDTNPNTRHTSDAPNAQNRMCSGKSAWEVMRLHPDFQGQVDTTNEPLKPTFSVTQVRDKRVVLVMDVSPSMSKNHRFVVMVQAVTKYIMNTIETGTLMGMVEFSNEASSIMNITVVGNITQRVSVVDRLPKTSSGAGTSIGSGLFKAIKILRDHNGQCDGQILLLSDGRETVKNKKIEHAMPEVLKCEVIVDTIAISDDADDNMQQLAVDTGGLSYFFKDNSDATDLMNAVDTTVSSRDTVGSQKPPVTVESTGKEVPPNGNVTGSVTIDDSIGFDTYITITSVDNINLAITLTDPESTTHDETSEILTYVKNVEGKSITIEIKGKAKSGEWMYTITNNVAESTSVSINVVSRPDANSDTFTVVSSVGITSILDFSATSSIKLTCKVNFGYAPVLNTEVVAHIKRPKGLDINLGLKDNGVGSDTAKNDGVYSASFVPKLFSDNGRYSVALKVKATESSSLVTHGDGTGALPIPGQYPSGNQPTATKPSGNFVRRSSAGDFNVANYTKSLAETDLIPPARVTDLTITAVDIDNDSANLTWTSVGDDIDQGNASRYELFVSPEMNGVSQLNSSNSKPFNDSAIVFGNLNTTTPPGILIAITVKTESMNTTSGTLYFGVRAVDAAENFAKISNIATAIFVIPQNTEFEVINGPKGNDDKPFDQTTNYIIVGVVLGVAALILVVTLLVVYSRRQRTGGATGSYDVSNINFQVLQAKV